MLLAIAKVGALTREVVRDALLVRVGVLHARQGCRHYSFQLLIVRIFLLNRGWVLLSILIIIINHGWFQYIRDGTLGTCLGL